MRVAQGTGVRGSLKWIQRALESRRNLVQPAGLSEIEWVSPLREDEFAEYRDAAFLDRLRLSHLHGALTEFWPRKGPQWDALGLANGAVVLVEAKAHIDEFVSPASQASDKSRERIQSAFAQVKSSLGVTNVSTDWAGTFYQYANRIAHLWWLRSQGVPAHLLFVGFLNDDDMGGPNHAETWQAAFRMADAALGLPKRHAMSPFIHHLTPSVRELS